MPSPKAAPLPPDRPPLAWRVGVTGHRDIPEPLVKGVRAAVVAVLARVRGTLIELAADPAAAEVHATASGPLLRVLSPLAEGADRMVAEEALAQGYRLEAALPFPQAEYEQDFDAASLANFRMLLACARDESGASRVTVLDGSQSLARQRSYELVGRFVVRNCDLLIAIWNGERAPRRGGTEDTVQAAITAGVPVWWIDPAQPDMAHLRGELPAIGADVAATHGTSALDALTRIIRLSVLPPGIEPPHAHGIIDRCVHGAARRLRVSSTPLRDYLREAEPGPARLRRLYGRFMDLVVGSPPGRHQPAPAPLGDVECWWERCHATAAGLSKVYGDRYRSSYVAVFLLAGLALLAAITAFVVPATLHVAVIMVEVMTLSGILVLVAANHSRRWQQRWITYRLLAELCRKQRVLAPLGWTLPVRDITRILGGREEPAEAPQHIRAPPDDAWVAWYFTAMRRAGPLPNREFTATALQRARDVGRAVFEEQRVYHALRSDRSEAASRRLAHWGEGFFLLALAGAAARIILELRHAPAQTVTIIGLACALSPAASATLLGIRGYAEFDLLARQSERMRQVMSDACRDLDARAFDGALASDDLGGILLSVTTAMLLDIDGWAQLFHVKALEAG